MITDNNAQVYTRIVVVEPIYRVGSTWVYGSNDNIKFHACLNVRKLLSNC